MWIYRSTRKGIWIQQSATPGHSRNLTGGIRGRVMLRKVVRCTDGFDPTSPRTLAYMYLRGCENATIIYIDNYTLTNECGSIITWDRIPYISDHPDGVRAVEL